MAYHEYNYNGRTTRTHGAGQRPTRLIVIRNDELDKASNELFERLGGHDGFYAWAKNFPDRIVGNQRLWLEAIQAKLAELNKDQTAPAG